MIQCFTGAFATVEELWGTFQSSTPLHFVTHPPNKQRSTPSHPTIGSWGETYYGKDLCRLELERPFSRGVGTSKRQRGGVGAAAPPKEGRGEGVRCVSWPRGSNNGPLLHKQRLPISP